VCLLIIRWASYLLVHFISVLTSFIDLASIFVDKRMT